jgi:hypothetical protein
LVAGVVLLVLGLGNWIMGLDKTGQYGRRMERAVEIGGPTARLPFNGTASILDEYTYSREFYADSLAKYEYYRVVRNGGAMLMLIGVGLMVGAAIRRVIVPTPRRDRPLPDSSAHPAG